jgi:hypothetical protein
MTGQNHTLWKTHPSTYMYYAHFCQELGKNLENNFLLLYLRCPKTFFSFF